ncbi:MAG TPA: response regulator [Longimicrobium sp.]|jgi:CheY-like chemotaxis protein|nr:response regulator [Longimicrobium sp.]
MYQAFNQADGDAQTVLIVEDQIEMRAINAMYLHHHGYRVLATDNGIEGVEAARANHPDLILMDISIPGMDGIRATAALKHDPETESIPVLIITAHPYGSVGKRALDAGCDGYLTKPCDPRRILQEVRALLSPAVAA